MQVLKLFIYFLLFFIYLVGGIFTILIEAGVKQEKRQTGIGHYIIMFLVWLASPVLVVLLFKEVFHKK